MSIELTDVFDRPDSDQDLGPNWGAWGSAFEPSISGNKVICSLAAPTYQAAIWTANNFPLGQFSEVVLTGTVGYGGPMVRGGVPPSGSYQAYFLLHTWDTGVTDLRVWDDAGGLVLLTDFGVVGVSGDKYRLNMDRHNVLRAYINDIQIGSDFINTKFVRSFGQPGFLLEDTTVADNWRGGGLDDPSFVIRPTRPAAFRPGLAR